MARLYTNENVPLPVAEALRSLGHDVLTVAESGNAGQAWPDAAVLDYAIREDRIVVTLNRRHFIRLHMERPEHTGIVVCTVDADFVGQARRIHESLTSKANLRGILVRVNRPDS